MKKTIKITTLIAFFLCSTIAAQAESVKREFRGAWLSTAWRIDWPTTSNEKDQKSELQKLLDIYVKANVNVCFFQVRSFSDAMYKSAYEPWSQYITGTRGKEPTYDPLQYAIEECHKRGIECHAWMNPYRYASADNTYGTLPTDYSQTNPEWLIQVGEDVILNPGIPEVRQRIVDVVADVVKNYDIDGVVFDDYFYLKGTTDKQDDAQYQAYNPDNLSRGDWRRAQVNQMVHDVNAAIKAINPWCRFGIGPAGVAASHADVAAKYGVPPCPSGSDWQYNSLFSEPVAWLMQNTIDYISPQVYWVIGDGTNDYSKIVPWWGMVAHKFNRHNYTSASLSDLNATTVKNYPGATEMEKQRIAAATNYDAYETVAEILVNRESALEGAPGMVFFSSTPIARRGFIPVLTQDVFSRKALVPALTWYKAEPQGLVTDLAVSGKTLTWKYGKSGLRYTIYAMPKEERKNISKLATSEYFVGMTYNQEYTLPNGVSTSTHAIAVCVFDRYGNEYAPRFVGEATAAKEAPQLVSPADKSKALLPGWLTWKPIADAKAYTVEIAYDAAFNDVIVCAQADSNALLTQKFSVLDGSKTVYWRVYSHKANAESACSATWSFDGKLFSVTSPADGAENVSTTPTISWDDAGSGTTYIVEVAESNAFKSTEIAYSHTTQETSVTVPADKLRYSKTYYVRVSASSSLVNAVSLVNMFTTESVEMVAPVISSPANESEVAAPTLRIEVEDTPNNGFRFEVNKSESFPKRTTKIVQTDPGVRVGEFEDLEDGEYYIRVATRIDMSTITSYSSVIRVKYQRTTGLNDVTSAAFYVANGTIFAAENMRYGVYTADGRLIVTGVTTSSQTILPELAQGLYIVRVEDKAVRYQVW